MEKYSMLGPGVLRPPEWKEEKPPPFDDIYRIQPTYFDCKIRMPNKLALSFEIFCRAPPFPFVPCTAFEVSIPPLTKRCTHSHCVFGIRTSFPTRCCVLLARAHTSAIFVGPVMERKLHPRVCDWWVCEQRPSKKTQALNP